MIGLHREHSDRYSSKCHLVLTVVLLAITVVSAQEASVDLTQKTIKTLEAKKVGNLRIDGVLESEWFTMTPADSFLQMEPNEGDPASLSTTVYVFYDRDALYVAFDCRDSATDSICGRILRRDRSDDSDVIYINLDSFHDLRNGYYFGVTAAGVQIDGTISDENCFDNTWDGIWESAVAIGDGGWTAEMRIPFQVFRHNGGGKDGWGVNFRRKIFRRQESDSWMPITRMYGERISDFGVLFGIKGIKSSSHVEVLPHAVGRWDAADGGGWHSENKIENLGVDLKIVPNASWTVDLTYQPDFAQVDIDAFSINLEDYPVYLSEKRPFFIEGRSLFEDSRIELLYTRRITDPDYGGRITGQWGDIRGTAFVARNRTQSGQRQDVGAGRVTWNLSRRSNIGITGTLLDQSGSRVTSGGMDCTMRWGKGSSFEMNFAGLDKAGYRAQPLDCITELTIAGKKAKFIYEFNYRGVDFDINDLGWTSYSNYMEHWILLNYRTYPREGFFQRLLLSANLTSRLLGDGKLPEWSFAPWISVTTRSNLTFYVLPDFGMSYRRRYVDENEGEHRDNFGWFIGERHPYTSWYLIFETDYRKPVKLTTRLIEGTYWEGRQRHLFEEVTANLRSNLRVYGELSWLRVWNIAEIDDGATTDYRLWWIKMRWAPFLNTSLRATMQWIEHADLLSVNCALAWNWQPGSWFYLVYDENRLVDVISNSHPGDRTIRLKWTYFLTLP